MKFYVLHVLNFSLNPNSENDFLSYHLHIIHAESKEHLRSRFIKEDSIRYLLSPFCIDVNCENCTKQKSVCPKLFAVYEMQVNSYIGFPILNEIYIPLENKKNIVPFGYSPVHQLNFVPYDPIKDKFDFSVENLKRHLCGIDVNELSNSENRSKGERKEKTKKNIQIENIPTLQKIILGDEENISNIKPLKMGVYKIDIFPCILNGAQIYENWNDFGCTIHL